MALADRIRDVIHEVASLDISIDTEKGPYPRVNVHQLRVEEVDLVEQILTDAGFVVYPVTLDGQTSYVYVDEAEKE